MLHFPRSTYHTRLGSGSLNPSHSSKRLEMNFPGGLQLQDQISGVSEWAAWGLECPFPGCSFSLKPRGVGSDGEEVREPGAEPGNRILVSKPSRTLIRTTRDSVHPLPHPQPTTHHPPRQTAVYAAEPPAGGATGPCGRRMQLNGTRECGHSRKSPFLRPISAALARSTPRHWPPPSQSGLGIHAPGRGRIPGIKGAWERTGSAVRKIGHQGALRGPIFLGRESTLRS